MDGSPNVACIKDLKPNMKNLKLVFIVLEIGMCL